MKRLTCESSTSAQTSQLQTRRAHGRCPVCYPKRVSAKGVALHQETPICYSQVPGKGITR